MKKMFFSLSILILTIGFSGCANKVHDYSVSADNIMNLKDLSKSGHQIKIGEFTDSGKAETKVMCRLATPIGTPKGETFVSYIKREKK